MHVQDTLLNSYMIITVIHVSSPPFSTLSTPGPPKYWHPFPLAQSRENFTFNFLHWKELVGHEPQASLSDFVELLAAWATGAGLNLCLQEQGEVSSLSCIPLCFVIPIYNYVGGNVFTWPRYCALYSVLQCRYLYDVPVRRYYMIDISHLLPCSVVCLTVINWHLR